MLTLLSSQEEILSDIRSAYWLLDVTQEDGTEHNWSYIVKENQYEVVAEETVSVEETVDLDYLLMSYTAKIISFGGVSLSKASFEFGLLAPNTLQFEVSNKGSVLTPSDFNNAEVLARLICSDGTTTMEIVKYKFTVPVGGCVGEYQSLRFSCEDFLQKYLKGTYPNTALLAAISPEYASLTAGAACVPKMFGTAYFPLTPIYITDARYYVLGLSDETYSIDAVGSPEDWETVDEYSSGSYTFTQSTKTINGVNYRVVQPILIDANGDGTADSCGLWKNGSSFLPAPFKVAASGTSTKTNWADIIQQVLEEFGVPTGDIDAAKSFWNAADIFDTWGLSANFGLNVKRDREELLSWMLSCCLSTLRVTDKIELHPFSKTSQKTFTSSLILKKVATVGAGDGGESYERKEGTFKRQSTSLVTTMDSGYIKFCPNTKPDFLGATILVKPDGTSADISSESLVLPEADNQNAQRVGELYFLLKLFREGRVSFTAKGSTLQVQPGDVVSINGANYGGTYDILLDKVTLTKSLEVKCEGTVYSKAFEDFGDSTPSSVSPSTDDTAVYWAGAETIHIGGKQNRFETIQAAFAAYGGGRFVLQPGTYTLENGGTGLPNNSMELVAETPGSAVVKNYAGSDGFIRSGVYSASEYRFKDLIFTSNNISVYSSMINLSTGGVVASASDLLVLNVVFNLSDSGNERLDASSGDTGIDASGSGFLKRAILEKVQIFDGKTGAYLRVQPSDNNGYALVKDCICDHLKNLNIFVYADQAVLDDNVIRQFVGSSALFLGSSSKRSSVSKNKIVGKSFASIVTVLTNVYALSVNSNNDLLVSENQLKLIDTRTKGDCTGIYCGGDKNVIAGNEIEIDVNKDENVNGILSSLNNSNLTGNIIKIDNPGISTAANRGVSISGDNNIISSTRVDMVNSGVNDVGVYLSAAADDNTGSDNLVDNAGTNLDDNGTGNTVSAV